MANLVPIHIDKETGELVATGEVITGPSSPGGGTGGDLSPGFLYEQAAPASIWNIIHNSGSEQLVCQIYTPAGQFILPDNILIIDGDIVQVTFGVPQDGRAHLLFFEVAP